MTRMMTPGLRKLSLTAHVTTSVGWFGAVAAFLVLALAGLNSDNPFNEITCNRRNTRHTVY